MNTVAIIGQYVVINLPISHNFFCQKQTKKETKKQRKTLTLPLDNFMMTNSFNVSAGIALLSLMCFGAVSVHGVETAVNLGTAEDFAILTKTGVTTTGVTFITGDIGTSPIDAASITGFDLILDSSTTSFSTSSLVEGKVYASDYTVPTPAKLTTAIGDLGTAIVNAAG